LLLRLPGLLLPRRLFGGALALHLRDVEKILPADQHETGQNDGQDGVAVVAHSDSVTLAGGRRPPARMAQRPFSLLSRSGAPHSRRRPGVPRPADRSSRTRAARKSWSMTAKSRPSASRRPTST